MPVSRGEPVKKQFVAIDKKMIVGEKASGGKNYAIVEDDEVKVILNEETKRIGYMPISETKGFAHSIIDALSM